MADNRFFKLAGPFELGYLAEITASELRCNSDAKKIVRDVAPLGTADANHISFLDNKKYLEDFKNTAAGACFVHPRMAEFAPASTVCLVNKNPYMAYAIAAQAFYPNNIAKEFISEKAVIDETAKIGKNCVIEAGAVIKENAKIGDNCKIDANAVICTGVEIGNNCTIGGNVYITHAIIGSNVVIYPGAVIGRQGFGFAIDHVTGFKTVPQLGRVIIEDNVEIGANTTIDRGAGPDTLIGEGTRIDNLVQIGHNVKIGKHCIIVAQVGISGSTKIGDFVMLGGQSGVAGHLHIGSGARIAAQSGIMRNIPDGAKEYMGSPALPLKQYMRQIATLSKLASTKKTQEENDE